MRYKCKGPRDSKSAANTAAKQEKIQLKVGFGDFQRGMALQIGSSVHEGAK
jgi:hypothetical protein